MENVCFYMNGYGPVYDEVGDTRQYLLIIRKMGKHWKLYEQLSMQIKI